MGYIKGEKIYTGVVPTPKKTENLNKENKYAYELINSCIYTDYDDFNAAIKSFLRHMFYFSCMYSRSGMAGSYNNSMFTHSRDCQTISQSGSTIIYFYENCIKVLIPLCPY